MTKSEKALKTIGEVAKIIEVPPHVIRFWEEQFSNIKPVKYNNRRYYSVESIETLRQIKNLLYTQKYSIKDAVNTFKKPKSNILVKIKDRLVLARKKLNSILEK